MTRKTIILTLDTEKALTKIGIQIKKARLRRNIRAEELAEQAGISKGTLTSFYRSICICSACAWHGK